MNLGDHQDLAEASGVATFCCAHPAPHMPLGLPGCGGTICNTGEISQLQSSLNCGETVLTKSHLRNDSDCLGVPTTLGKCSVRTLHRVHSDKQKKTQDVINTFKLCN